MLPTAMPEMRCRQQLHVHRMPGPDSELVCMTFIVVVYRDLYPRQRTAPASGQFGTNVTTPRREGVPAYYMPAVYDTVMTLPGRGNHGCPSGGPRFGMPCDEVARLRFDKKQRGQG